MGEQTAQGRKAKLVVNLDVLSEAGVDLGGP